jgi:hypothetical protein
MRRFIPKIYSCMRNTIARCVIPLENRIRFISDFRAFKQMYDVGPRAFSSLVWSERMPCLNDKQSTTGFDRHYLYHPAWAARVLANTKPELHTDISSILHFSSLISAFIPTRFYDYRPADVFLANLECGTADLLKLPFDDNSVESLSCMHVVEHIGLGRYGDPIDSCGDVKAMQELLRVLAVGGNLLFVVPVGKPKIMFNAHRIYSYEQIVHAFSTLNLVEFALIPEEPKDGGILDDATCIDVSNQVYGCGCFWFKKL